jgi:hypothetical protein
MNNLEQEFQNVQPLLYKLAHRYSQSTLIPFDECLAECYWAFMKAANKWDPQRGKFSTYVYFLCQCRLKSLSMDQYRSMAEASFEDTRQTEPVEPEPSPTLAALREELKGDARTVLELLMEVPKELYEEGPLSLHGIASRLFRYLKEEQHWTRRRFKQAWQEVKAGCQAVWAGA